MSGEPVVSLRNVTKTFGTGGVTALQEIDLDVRPGEFVSLIGPSGCGKSTLLRVVGDLVDATSGDVVVNGKSARQARRDGDYGIVFQDPVLYDWRTVEKNIALPLELLGWNRVQRGKRVARAARARRAPGLRAPTTPGSSQAECSSASRSRGRSRSPLRSCSWTSRSARWTR